jgi:serine/threonine protein kinase
MAEEFAEFAEGKIIRNRYEIKEILGEGGFGVTYKAIDKDLPNQPYCVVKHLKPKNLDNNLLKYAQELFFREAKYFQDLGEQYDQIPTLYAYFEEKGEFFIVQEFIEGNDLSEEINENSQWNETSVIQLMLDISGVLGLLHYKNIVHRDIKPQNLIRRQKDKKIVMIDFGAVREITVLDINAQGQKMITKPVGTLEYMPKEQFGGEIELCSDIYALGWIGIQALTGLRPIVIKSSSSGVVNLRQYVPNISDRLADVLNKMVHEDYKQRYISALEVEKALKILKMYKPDKGEKYVVLEAYLRSKRWKEADKETTNLILKEAGRTQEGYVDIPSIERLSCEVLSTIDALWLHYSNARFGFSVQNRIWKEVGGEPNANRRIYEKFARHIGWWKEGDLLWYTNIMYEDIDKAPTGQLPTGNIGDIALFKKFINKFGGFGLKRIKVFSLKFSQCGIE